MQKRRGIQNKSFNFSNLLMALCAKLFFMFENRCHRIEAEPEAAFLASAMKRMKE